MTAQINVCMDRESESFNLEMLRYVDSKSQNSSINLLIRKFWKLKSIYLEVAKVEKHNTIIYSITFCPNKISGAALL